MNTRNPFDTLGALGYCLEQAEKCALLGYETSVVGYLETAEVHRKALMAMLPGLLSGETPFRPEPPGANPKT